MSRNNYAIDNDLRRSAPPGWPNPLRTHLYFYSASEGWGECGNSAITPPRYRSPLTPRPPLDLALPHMLISPYVLRQLSPTLTPRTPLIE